MAITNLLSGTYAISNTGPLISAFQSNSFVLLTKIFTKIYITTACVAEFEKHGWGKEIRAASPRLVVVKLKPSEEKRAMVFAEQIAQHPDTNDPVIENHLGESQALALAFRPEHRSDLILLDELAARAVAQRIGVRLSGFAGSLILAARANLISADDLRARLEICRAQGTHYSATFIRQVYEMVKHERR